jgi:lysophospholipase L1-like esterase
MNLRLFLTLLFFSTAASFSADTPQPPDAKVRIVLVGDSTVAAKSGWGTAFGQLLKPEAECLNQARGGESTKSFLDRGSLDRALALKPAWVLIQFGHNDQPGKGPKRETDPATTYSANLRRFVNETRAAGAKPVIITSMVRRVMVEGRVFGPDLEPYAEAARKIAAEMKVPLVDLHARSKAFVEKMSAADMAAMSPPHKDPTVNDRTHLTERGGEMIAPLIADELRRVAPELAVHLTAPKN